MLPVFTSAGMRACDAAATARYGVPSIVLMENAARGAADELRSLFPLPEGARIAIYCGKGNNGGDGFALARHLVNRGFRVSLRVLADASEIAGDAAFNLRILEQTLPDTVLLDLRFADAAGVEPHPVDTALIVDAILGTGLSSPLSGAIEALVHSINGSGIPVLALDIPTGIHADSGSVLGAAVRARATVTMAGLKQGLLFGAGREHAAITRIVDIGMPRQGFYEEAATAGLAQDSDVASLLPVRAFDAHKYSAGTVALLAGSSGYTGAAAMAAMAAEASLRSGAGLVTLGCPRTLQPILAGKLTEVITRPFADSGEGSFSISGFEEALAFLNGARAGVIGPGISRHPETLDFARRIMRECTTPLVVDADALFALAGHDVLLRERRAATILTPHAGEFARLTGNRIGDAADERIAAARAYAEAHGVHVVLKGAPTITAAPSGRVVITNTGNPGMATAGSGDVLSGVLAALLAQGVDADAATWMGTHMHGMAGDRAAQETGMPGLIATDLLRAIALVLRDLAAGTASGV